MNQNKISKTEKQFSKAAKTYDANANIHRNVAGYLLAHSKFTATNDLILDIGSGTGILSELLISQFTPDYILNVDLSFEMLQKGREKFPTSAFVQANISSLPFACKFNTVVSSMALQWLEHPKIIAEIIASTLTSKGVFACSIVLKGTFELITNLRAEILGQNHENNESQAERLPSFEDLKFSFKEFGLNLRRSEQHGFTQKFESIEQPFQAIRDLGISGTANRSLTKDEVIELKKRYAERLQKDKLNPYLDYKVGFFWGERS